MSAYRTVQMDSNSASFQVFLIWNQDPGILVVCWSYVCWVKYRSATYYYLFPFPNPHLPKHTLECGFVINVIRIIWRACGTCCWNESVLNLSSLGVFLHQTHVGLICLNWNDGNSICEGHITFSPPAAVPLPPCVRACVCVQLCVCVYVNLADIWKIHEAQLTSSRTRLHRPHVELWCSGPAVRCPDQRNDEMQLKSGNGITV